MSLKSRIVERACELGFDSVGITSAEPFRRDEAAIRERIARGFFAGIDWFTKERTQTSCYPTRQLAGAASIVSLAISYDTGSHLEPRREQGPLGRISNYAWSDDYHTTIGRRLKELKRFVAEEAGMSAKPCVDSSPMVDRAAAARAGVGFFGKNANIIAPGLGSFVFLAELVVDKELEADRPSSKSCGTCTQCIPACPTGAIVAPYVINSSRCISFLTIENRGPIPRELRPLVGNRIFGCDDCQEVCPINRRAKPMDRPEFRPRPGLGPYLPLLDLLTMSDDEFRIRFRGSPLRRAGRSGFLRNVAVALGNCDDRAAIAPLATRLRAEPDPLVRGHIAWALGRLGGERAAAALEQAQTMEVDPFVCEEIALTIAESGQKE